MNCFQCFKLIVLLLELSTSKLYFGLKKSKSVIYQSIKCFEKLSMN